MGEGVLDCMGKRKPAEHYRLLLSAPCLFGAVGEALFGSVWGTGSHCVAQATLDSRSSLDTQLLSVHHHVQSSGIFVFCQCSPTPDPTHTQSFIAFVFIRK